MTDTLREQLSCFLDGELPEAETTLLLKRLERDEELQGSLSRYSLIGAVLRTDTGVPAARHVAARVRAALAGEPALGAQGWRARWLRQAVGLAVAAGVAAAAILVLPAGQTEGPGAAEGQFAALPPEPVVTEMIPVVRAPENAEEPVRTYTTPPAPAEPANALSAAQLASYLLAHSDYSGPLARRSVVTVVVPEAQDGTAEVDAQ